MDVQQTSTLAPAAWEAARIATLWWWMLGGAFAIWVIMISLTYYAIYGRQRFHLRRMVAWIVIGGGVVFPTITLLILLCFGLSLLPKLLAAAPQNTLTINVHSAQWWWRVRYLSAGQEQRIPTEFELANEIVLPVDEPVEFLLNSEDVIHTFWIPSLGGKVDMIPGRTTRLLLHPYRTGSFRGVCAEYCGTSHAYMNFDVRVVTRAEFQSWLADQQRPELSVVGESAQRGRREFFRHGCGACHTIRGSSARGVVGPDLTHFGSRQRLGAGMYQLTSEAIFAWLKHADHLKPEVEMPGFSAIGDDKLRELAAYLEQLK